MMAAGFCMDVEDEPISSLIGGNILTGCVAENISVVTKRELPIGRERDMEFRWKDKK